MASLVSNTFWKRVFIPPPFLRYSFRYVSQSGHNQGVYCLYVLSAGVTGMCRYALLGEGLPSALMAILLLRVDVLSFVAFLQSSAVVLLVGVGIPRS